METLLVRLSSPRLPSPEDTLASAVGRVLGALPAFEIPFDVRSGSWSALANDDLHVDWATSVPRIGSSTIVVQSSDEGLLIFWGELLEAGPLPSVIWGAYKAGGIDAVRGLDGCFSVIIGSAANKTVDVCGDLIGQRGLRLAEVNGFTLLSPHDACLVAGGLPITFDDVSQASCFVIQHSLQSRPLLRNVKGLEGNDVVSFTGGARATHRRLAKLEFAPRIELGDTRAQKECREWAAARIIDTTKRWASSGTPLRCELTAGLDSRATLACLLGAQAQPYIEAVTGGGADSLDVRTAAHLARLAKVRHKVVADSEVQMDQFVEHATLRAFATNGETEAKRASSPLPRWNPDGITRVGGASSEVFRGFFYSCMGPTGVAPRDFSRVLSLLISRRMRDFDALPLATPETRVQLRERLRSCFDEYAALSPDGNDALDLFYLFERCAHWSSHVTRSTWNRTRNPLMIPSVIRALYRLPAPLGHNVAIHTHLIRQYFPESKWVLINGARPVALEGPGHWRAGARFVLSAARTRMDRYRHRYLGAHKPKAAKQADHFSGALYPVVEDLFTAPESVVSRLLGERGAAQILLDHRSGNSRLAWLGFGITQELYARFLKKVAPSNR